MSDSSLDIRPKKKAEGKKILIFVILFIVLLGTSYFISKNNQGGEKVDFDLYVMSQCPYGTQAEGLVLSIMDDFENYVNFNVEYIANFTADGTFSSLHGQPEVGGDLYQLCVKQNFPDKFWPYLECQNKNYQDLSSTFESCANEVGVDFSTIQSCAQGDEGKELLTTSLNKAKELNVGGSPTFYINNELYTGPRTEIALKKALCGAIDNKAKPCDDLPQDVEFKAYLITDSRCTKPECATDKLTSQLKSTFAKIKFEELDYNSDKGKEYYKKYNLTYLPALLLEKDIEKTDSYSQIKPYLTETDDLYSLAIGATYDPRKEICDNNQDDTNNGLIDCDDPECNGALECRTGKAGRLDIFVMSMCPYGIKGLNAIKEVLDNFGDDIDFHVNYIANENSDGSFSSLHGQPEVDENIRELCAMKYYPDSYMNYVWCRNKDIKGDYTNCAADFQKIKTCASSNEGKKLLSQNIKLTNELGIGASPTWMVNNKYKFNGIDAETVKTNFCKYNDVAGCDNALSGQPVGSGSAPSAAGSCN